MCMNPSIVPSSFGTRSSGVWTSNRGPSVSGSNDHGEYEMTSLQPLPSGLDSAGLGSSELPPSLDAKFSTIDLSEPRPEKRGPVRRRMPVIDLGSGSAPTTVASKPSKKTPSTRTLPDPVRQALRTIRRSADTRLDSTTGYDSDHDPDAKQEDEDAFRKWSRAVRREGRYVSVKSSHPRTIDYLTKLSCGSEPVATDMGNGQWREKGESSAMAQAKGDIVDSAGVVLEWIESESKKRAAAETDFEKLCYGYWAV